MGIIQVLFGGNKKGEKLANYLEKGAVIVDVRSVQEFRNGHVKGSKNIPLQQIESKVSEIRKWNSPVVLCCASGMRSGQAALILKKKDVDCINGGSWTRLDAIVSSLSK